MWRSPDPDPLDSGDACHLTETLTLKVQEESTSRTTEAILYHLENSATSKVDVLLLNREGHHGVHHVLENVRASHLSGLINLSDDDSVTEVLFTEISNHSQRTLCRTAVGMDTVLTVIEAL